MLEFSINTKKTRIKYDVLDTYNMLQSGESIEMSVDSYVDISVNDIISFYRKDGDDIEYYDEKIVKNVVFAGENTAVFTIDSFSILNLKVIEKELKTFGNEQYFLFKFDKDLYANSTYKNVKKNVTSQEEIDALCIGDVFVENDYFLKRKVENGTESACERCELFWFATDEDIVVSENAYVPCTLDGHDMKRTLLLKLNSQTLHLYDNYDVFKIWVRDLRFFQYAGTQDEGILNLSLKQGANVRIRKGDPSLKITVDSDFSPYLLSNDGISQYLEQEAEKSISEALDYEKQQFVPVIYEGSTIRVVNSICFYIHLRERDENWDVKPNGDWASSGLPGPHFDVVDNVLGNGDFSEEDIYYQRKCVSETFLRLSFYDAPDRGSQKLLYTAKLYLDENRLWTEYVKQINDTDKDIKFYFVCTNKYDYDNKTEGFYLYLFPGNVKELTEAGSAGTIYMKVELCHAKYGKTIPLTLPVYPNKDINNDVYSRDFGRGKNYLKSKIADDGQTFQYTDVDELKNDMYIKIRLKYDSHDKRYVWYFEGANSRIDADNLDINLYEPKMFPSNGNN